MFQLIFHPSQDKFSKFQTSRISENSLRMPPDTDANLLLIQTPNSEMFQTWIPFLYSPTHLRHTVQQTFLDGISKPIPRQDSVTSPDGSFKPIPDTIKLTHQQVQISRHSSVQSSSTFKSRMEDTPI